jgi:curved DNA-binding protein CbpA
MASPLPPDPYLALGLPRDATAATIKTTYRKLILKFHPDKVQDAAQKQIASDQFHKVQTAYEIIGEEERRARYDAQCKLVELRKEMMQKQGGGASAQSEVRASSYSRNRPESPARPNYTARGSERSERVHVEERRPYDAEPDYFDRPRSAARKDAEYERPSAKRPTPAPAPRTEKERARATRQSTKENERARQKEKTRQTTRNTRRDRDFKYNYADPETPSDSDSDGIVETPRYTPRREEDERRRERDPYYEQPRRQKEESPRAFHMEDRSHHKMQSHEMSARDYIERAGGRSRQHQDSARRPSPPPQRLSTKDKVEYIKRSEGRPAVMVRRGSGRPRPQSREPEELPRRESPRRESPRRDRERTRRSSHDYSDLPRTAPPLNSTKSAPEQIHIPDAPRRAYSMQTDAKTENDFRPPPMRRADTMPNQNARRERESTRKPQKSSGLRRGETMDNLPTPATTPEPTTPHNAKYPYGREYADDHEFATPSGYRTELHAPAAGGNRKVTRSPSPIKEERVKEKEERGRASSSRYPPTAQRPPLPSSRTTSYVYTPQGLQDMAAGRPSLARSETARTDMPLYGEVPTSRSSPRQTRARHSPPGAEPHYPQPQYRPDDVKYQTGHSSRRASETLRPSYARGNSYTSQAAY